MAVCQEDHVVQEAANLNINNVSINKDEDQEEFDFIEQPAEEFFCPVTFELLLDPHQTRCCGHHISWKAVSRLQREVKPCPLCNEPKLLTVPDKFFKRKANQILIRCPHKGSGCEWTGEVGGSKEHIRTCPKRQWMCQYCDLMATFDAGKQHEQICLKYPVPCPNKCEIGTVTRCDLEKHHAECPLEPVACEFADVGCSVKVARRDLQKHMEENQQQHLLSATLLNLKLTTEVIAERDHQLAEIKCQIDEKIRQLADKDVQLAESKHKLMEQERQLAEKDQQIVVRDRQLAEKDSQILQVLEQLQQRPIVCLQGFVSIKFTINNFSECQKSGEDGDWFSHPLDVSGHVLKLYIQTNECTNNYLRVGVCTDSQDFGRLFQLALLLFNQQNSNNHFFRWFETPTSPSHKLDYYAPYNYIEFRELIKDENIQYLKGDRLEFFLWIRKKVQM